MIELNKCKTEKESKPCNCKETEKKPCNCKEKDPCKDIDCSCEQAICIAREAKRSANMAKSDAVQAMADSSDAMKLALESTDNALEAKKAANKAILETLKIKKLDEVVDFLQQQSTLTIEKITEIVNNFEAEKQDRLNNDKDILDKINDIKLELALNKINDKASNTELKLLLGNLQKELAKDINNLSLNIKTLTQEIIDLKKYIDDTNLTGNGD